MSVKLSVRVKTVCVLAMMFCSIGAVAKNKQTFQIEVVDTKTWQREWAIEHEATPGKSETHCDTNGNADTMTIGNSTYGNGNATTNCTTTTTPGTPAYTENGATRQESVHVIWEGKHFTLWCQQGFRKCAPLEPGLYTMELDRTDHDAVRIYAAHPLTNKVSKIKYKLAGTW